MQIVVKAVSELATITIGDVRIPAKLTYNALAWLQKNGHIASPRLKDFQKFAAKSGDELIPFLAPVLAAMAAGASLIVEPQAIALALGETEVHTLLSISVIVQAAIYRSYAGEYPPGKESAVPVVAAPDGTASRGTGATPSSRQDNAE